MYDVEGGYRKTCTPLLKRMTSKEELAVKKKKAVSGCQIPFIYVNGSAGLYLAVYVSIVPMVGIVMAFQDYNPSKDGSALRG